MHGEDYHFNLAVPQVSLGASSVCSLMACQCVPCATFRFARFGIDFPLSQDAELEAMREEAEAEVLAPGKGGGDSQCHLYSQL